MALIEIDKLKGLDSDKQLAFAYLTCERLYPNYNYFSINYNYGDPGILREAIDFLYRNIFEDKIDVNKKNILQKK